ncbi:hypothetical protein SAMN05216489_06646 [Streptomyces sp. 3213]|nr:hypothetical protein SAMN05216489_06646 [Streptomyces sp. 3213] [Streptomyces sp. 3213.3]
MLPAGAGPSERTGPRGAFCPNTRPRRYRRRVTSRPGGSDTSASTAEPQQPLVCARCGTRSEGPQPTWTCSVENGTRHYFCDACARENLRAIEGRLDSDWW